MSSKLEKNRIAIRYWLQGRGYLNTLKAMDFGANYHVGSRKDGTPEFYHQISIVSYLRTLPSLDRLEDTLTTAFLHDIREDYNVSHDTISSKFGKDVADAVSKLSKESGDNLHKYFAPMSECPIASIVKGADRIHNFQTMTEVFTKEKQEEYILECKLYIMPMLKEARRKFVSQEPAYENIKLVLTNQMELIEQIIRG